MCLPDFIENRIVLEDNPITGYRIWRNPIKDSIELFSEYKHYKWTKLEGPHEVLEKDSGIYAYNYNNNNSNYHNYYYNNYDNYYYYNNYDNYYYYYYNNNNNNSNYHNYNYYITGTIKQYGKVAIHKTGQRSEFAKIDTLFNIRESDAKGPKEFLDWIKIFNERINKIAEKYECKVISQQDFIESQK